MLNRALTAALALGIGSSFAYAATIPGTGAGFDITDNATFTSDIVIGTGGSITDVTVSLDFSTTPHTWIGDLIVSIENVEDAVSVELFNRVGRTGGAGAGDSSDVDGIYNFNDAFTGDLWAAAAAAGASVPAGDYFPTGFEGGLTLLSAFDGLDAAGTWRLTISDNASGDTGTLDEWNLTIETSDAAVPEPTTFVLFGAALGALALFRRKQGER